MSLPEDNRQLWNNNVFNKFNGNNKKKYFYLNWKRNLDISVIITDRIIYRNFSVLHFFCNLIITI